MVSWKATHRGYQAVVLRREARLLLISKRREKRRCRRGTRARDGEGSAVASICRNISISIA